MLTKYLNKIRFFVHVFNHYKNGLEIVTTKPPQTLQKIFLRNGISFTGNTTTQLLAITDEIFFNQVYTHPHVEVEEGDIVVDIGANVGIFSTFAVTQDASHVYAYEPFPKNVQLIKKNLKLNNIQNVTVTQAAVSDKLGKAKLYLGEVDAGNLLFDHNVNGKLTKYIVVPTVTLERILQVHNLQRIDFLKIDCEGSEGAILVTTPAKIWKKIKKVALEYHDNVSLLSHREIKKKLHKLGFKTHVLTQPNSPFGYIYGWRG